MEKIILHLKGFKCFKDSSFELNNLTALTGANASGKSSVIQALLLLDSVVRSQVFDGKYEIALSNTSGFLDLGNVDNILQFGGEDKAIISVNGVEFCFRSEDEVRRGSILINCSEAKFISDYPFCNLSYLSSERKWPSFEMDMDQSRLRDCGSKGEFITRVIRNNDLTKVTPQRTFDKKESVDFRTALDVWLDYIFPGINLNVNAIESAKCPVNGNKDNPFVDNLVKYLGSGISYALPIILTCLLAGINDTMIIENPEGRLHPKAQSNMGFFLGKMAAAGLRILLETHSEHIINGIRRAIVSNIGLQPEGVSIYFLENCRGEFCTHHISVDARGNLSAFPVDFFDQQRQDSKAIFDIISRRS